MELTERDFKVLDALERYDITSQRQLAYHAGVSLGKVNYALRSLLDKDLVKLGNFQNNPNKMISYAYLLTPAGIEAKSRLAVRFVIGRLKEYDSLRQILTEKLSVIEKNGQARIIIVGSKTIREFLISIINEQYREYILIGQCNSWKDLNGFDPDQYDLVLLFDDREEDKKTISESTGIPQEKLVLLW